MTSYGPCHHHIYKKGQFAFADFGPSHHEVTGDADNILKSHDILGKDAFITKVN